MDPIKNSKFHFSQPTVKTLNFTRNQLDSDLGSTQSNLPIEIGTTICDLDDSEHTARVQVTVSIGDSALHPFSIEISLEAFFSWENVFTTEEVSDLLNANASSLLYGYARQIVAFITSSSGYPTLHLPFADFTKE